MKKEKERLPAGVFFFCFMRVPAGSAKLKMIDSEES